MMTHLVAFGVLRFLLIQVLFGDLVKSSGSARIDAESAKQPVTQHPNTCRGGSHAAGWTLLRTRLFHPLLEELLGLGLMKHDVRSPSDPAKKMPSSSSRPDPAPAVPFSQPSCYSSAFRCTPVSLWQGESLQMQQIQLRVLASQPSVEGLSSTAEAWRHNSKLLEEAGPRTPCASRLPCVGYGCMPLQSFESAKANKSQQHTTPSCKRYT